MNTLNDEFKAGAEQYAARLRADRERRENHGKTTADNGQRFADHLQAKIEEQRANGTRININNL